MIGGWDTVLAGSGPDDEGVFIVSELRREWPHLRVQDVDADDTVVPDSPAITHMLEFFVFRSPSDFDSWMADGATEANDDTMIHIILGPASTTFVSAGRGSATHRLVTALCPEVDRHRLLAELAVRRAPMRAPPPGDPPV